MYFLNISKVIIKKGMPTTKTKEIYKPCCFNRKNKTNPMDRFNNKFEESSALRYSFSCSRHFLGYSTRIGDDKKKVQKINRKKTLL
jgi:hypothetical protein